MWCSAEAFKLSTAPRLGEAGERRSVAADDVPLPSVHENEAGEWRPWSHPWRRVLRLRRPDRRCTGYLGAVERDRGRDEGPRWTDAGVARRAEACPYSLLPQRRRREYMKMATGSGELGQKNWFPAQNPSLAQTAHGGRLLVPFVCLLSATSSVQS